MSLATTTCDVSAERSSRRSSARWNTRHTTAIVTCNGARNRRRSRDKLCDSLGDTFRPTRTKNTTPVSRTSLRFTSDYDLLKSPHLYQWRSNAKLGGGAGGGRVEDAEIFVRSDKNGQGQEWVHQRDSAGGAVWRGSTRGKTEVVRTCTEERCRGILGEGCWRRSCQERGNGEGLKGGLWMRWERIWHQWMWQRKTQRREQIGDEESAVATPDSRSQNKKKLVGISMSRYCMGPRYLP